MRKITEPHTDDEFGIENQTALRSAIAALCYGFERGEAIPSALKNELLRFYKAQTHQRLHTVLIPKLVERYAAAGNPKSNQSKVASAWELAGAAVGVSASTAQRAEAANLPDDDAELSDLVEFAETMESGAAMICKNMQIVLHANLSALALVSLVADLNDAADMLKPLQALIDRTPARPRQAARRTGKWNAVLDLGDGHALMAKLHFQATGSAYALIVLSESDNS